MQSDCDSFQIVCQKRSTRKDGLRAAEAGVPVFEDHNVTTARLVNEIGYC